MGKFLADYYRESMKLAKRTAGRLRDSNITMLAPSFYPARLVSTVKYLHRHDVKVFMAGGGPGPNMVDGVRQFKLLKDTTAMDETEENIRRILGAIPPKFIPRRIGILLYNSVTEGDNLWKKCLEDMFPTRVVCSNEQNLTSFFEEKTNLVDILEMAGLKAQTIPTELIKEDKTTFELMEMYKKLMDNTGRVVVQSCGPGVSEIGGGHSTVIAKSFTEFYEACKDRQGYLKVAKFIEGVNSNVSICAGNIIPSPTKFGALRGSLLPDESRYSRQTLVNLLERGKESGLNKGNIVSFVQPGTLKVVGDEHLTTCATNGVGNQLNYSFNKDILENIYSIGSRLGEFMALCGKVGLFGIDLIITKEGKIYINEINDRQQGPTETASLNNENHSLPGILRVGFLQNYANFRDKRVVDFMKGITSHSKEIYDESVNIESPYYIKLAGERVAKPSAVTISSGTYLVHKSEDGTYEWDLSKSFSKKDKLPDVLPEGTSAYNLASVSLKQGEMIYPDRQVARINGVGEAFYIEDGLSKLNPEMVPVIDALKSAIYGEEFPQKEDPKDTANQTTLSNDEDLVQD